MVIQKNFIRFTSVCCFITVITTLGIHAWFPDPPAGFEERILLFRSKIYLLNRWWVIAHCLLVITAMWGFAILQLKKTPGWTGLGLLFFCVFGIAEITRQMMVLLYANALREQYYMATDEVTRNGLKIVLSTAGQLTAPLFGVFILMFGLGNLCYGFSLIHSKGLSKLLSILLIISAIANFVILGNSFWKVPAIDETIEKYSYTFTPFLRAITGFWLWKNSSRVHMETFQLSKPHPAL
jgi:hypothetical protein